MSNGSKGWSWVSRVFLALASTHAIACGDGTSPLDDAVEVRTSQLTGSQLPTYRAGPILEPHIYPVFWGSWGLPTEVGLTRALFDSYITDMTTYMNGANAPSGLEPVLFQYGVYGATREPSVVDNHFPGHQITTADIEAEIQSLQASGALPPYQQERLFLVITKAISASIPGGCGIHNAVGGSNWGQYWAWAPAPDSIAGCGTATTSRWEKAISHEVFEAATDPLPGTGWYATGQGEIGDVCVSMTASIPGGTVQKVANKTQANCAVWNRQRLPSIAVTRTFNETSSSSELHNFAVGSDLLLQFRGEFGGVPSPPSGFDEALNIGALRPEQPAVAGWAGSTHAFVNLSNGTLWHFGTGVIGGWEPVVDSSHTFIGPPAAVSWGPNRIDLFAMTPDGTMWHTWCTGSCVGNFAPWENHGGALMGPPSVVSAGVNLLDIFGWGQNGQICEQRWNGSSWVYWNGSSWIPSITGWGCLGGTFIAPPAAVVPFGQGGRVDVFGIGTDSNLYQRTDDPTLENGNAWTTGGWQGLGGGPFIGPPVVTSMSAPYSMHVFAQKDDNTYSHLYYDFGFHQWFGWETVPGGRTFVSAPSVADFYDSVLDVYGRGTDGAAYRQRWSSVSRNPPWSTSWELIGGSLH